MGDDNYQSREKELSVLLGRQADEYLFLKTAQEGRIKLLKGHELVLFMVSKARLRPHLPRTIRGAKHKDARLSVAVRSFDLVNDQSGIIRSQRTSKLA